MASNYPKKSETKIYIPSFARDAVLLQIVPFTYLSSFIIALFVLITDKDFSWLKAQLFLGVLLIFYFIWACLMAVVYLLIKQSAKVIFIDNESLAVKSDKHKVTYTLDSIDYFSIVRTCSPLTWGTTKRDLFILDKIGDSFCVYSDGGLKAPNKAWKKFGVILNQRTGKKVIYHDYIEDSDGEILTPEDLAAKNKKAFQKKMGL